MTEPKAQRCPSCGGEVRPGELHRCKVPAADQREKKVPPEEHK